MSANTFLTVVNGITKRLTALVTSAGVGDANKIIMTDGTGKIDMTLMPVGVGQESTVRNAGENLTAGDFVWFNGSGLAVKADNTSEKPADGYVSVGVTSGQPATVFRKGTNAALAGLTPGTRYWLGVAGGVTVTAPTATGSIVQILGVANSTSEINFDIRNYVLNG